MSRKTFSALRPFLVTCALLALVLSAALICVVATQWSPWRSHPPASLQISATPDTASRTGPHDVDLKTIAAARQHIAAPDADASASADTRQIARGAYLAALGDCVACHTPRGATPYSGNYAVPTPFGTMYTSNLTPDEETGIGKWTSDDFYRALHEGISRDGSFLYPAFPFTSYTLMPRADSDDIFAYLQSLPPVHNPRKANEMPFPFNQRMILIGWRMMFFKKGEFVPDRFQIADWNRGKYLVDGPGHCAMCHTQINPLGAPKNSSAFSGGLIPVQNWYAPSLTPARPLGIADWNIDDLQQFLRTGISDKGVAYGPMADVVYNSTQYMSEADARSMAIYLKSLPRTEAAPEPAQISISSDYETELFRHGAKLFTDHCAKCHGSKGQGNLPDFPPLAGNGSIIMPSAVNPIKIVLHGGFPPATAGNPRPYGMPPYAHVLSDLEVAAVVTYVRNAWGNAAQGVSPQQVNSLRSAALD